MLKLQQIQYQISSITPPGIDLQLATLTLDVAGLDIGLINSRRKYCRIRNFPRGNADYIKSTIFNKK